LKDPEEESMKSKVILAVAVGVFLIILIAVLVIWRRATDQQYVVIGEEFAKARQAEEVRKKKGGTGPSPMPAGEYDRWRGETNLLNPTKNSLDSELSILCRRFATSDAPGRSEMRAAISLDEFYTLLNFSRRSAVFAIREKNVDWIKNGLTAVAMVDVERIDYRDLGLSLPLLYHSAKRIGADPDQLIREASELAEPGVKTTLTSFISRSVERKDLRSSLFDEIETAGGTGFIEMGFEKYHPTLDLKKIVVDLGEVIAKDKYQPSLEIASKLPAVWLESNENPSLETVLQKVRAGASIDGELRPNEHPSHNSQTLMVFLVEMEDSRAAQELLEMSRRKRSDDYSMVAVSEGKLFCLVIGRSFQQGVASFETPETIQRFAAPISEVLKRFSTSGG
jgi:hypothetical protein